METAIFPPSASREQLPPDPTSPAARAVRSWRERANWALLWTMVAGTAVVLVWHALVEAYGRTDDWQLRAAPLDLPLRWQVLLAGLAAGAASLILLNFCWLLGRFVDLIGFTIDLGFAIAPGGFFGPKILAAFLLLLGVLASISGPMVNNITEQGPNTGEMMGYAVGGAKDVNVFREKVARGLRPAPADLTCEGLFYDYTFDAGLRARARHLFEPSYSCAVTTDPLNGNQELFLSVGLNSNIDTASFKRPKLNLVVALDVSGSMQGSMHAFYRDDPQKYRRLADADDEDGESPKIEVAKTALAALIDRLQPDDRLGIVIYSHRAQLAKPMRRVGGTDLAAIKRHIGALTAYGGTDMEDGYQTAISLLEPFTGKNLEPGYANRIIFLTDAMPNLGQTDPGYLFDEARIAAEKGIHTSFIGIGVDFQTELVGFITKVPGANYHAVRSASSFKRLLSEEFELMVTPVVFDLQLTLQTRGYEIKQVYGAPSAVPNTGELIRVGTLFPSRVTGGETRGGMILVKLARTKEPGAHLAGDPATSGDLRLEVSYRDRDGRAERHENCVVVPTAPLHCARLASRAAIVAATGHCRPSWATATDEIFENTGIRKAVLLSRYYEACQAWLGRGQPMATPGDYPPPPVWSGSLADRNRFATLRTHFEREAAAIGDATLARELKVLERLSQLPDEDLVPVVRNAGPVSPGTFRQVRVPPPATGRPPRQVPVPGCACQLCQQHAAVAP